MAQMHFERRAQHARRAGVGTEQTHLFVQCHHTRRQVVQYGLQVGTRTVHLGHAVLHGVACIGKFLRHVGKGARQAGQFVFGGQRQFGGQVATRHVTHTFGQHQQWVHQLVAQQHRQQHRPEYGQKQRQRQGTNVHAAQAFTPQSAFLVFAVGLLHRQRIGHQRSGQGGSNLQIARPATKLEVGGRDQRQHPYAGHCRSHRGAAGFWGSGGQATFFL